MIKAIDTVRALHILVAVVPLLLAGVVTAHPSPGGKDGDSVTLRGSAIPMRGCAILEIKSGRVYFSGARGRREWRELDDVAALGFEGLPRLDAAERLLADGEETAGIRALLAALLDAEGTDDGSVREIWIRIRLAQVHGGRGDFIQAAGHAAAVFMVRDESAWRVLAPLGAANRSDYAAAKEAMEALDLAGRRVRSSDLRTAVERMKREIRPVFEALGRAYDGPPIDPGSTRSGIFVEEITGVRKPAARPAPPGIPARGAPPDEPAQPGAAGKRRGNQDGARGPGVERPVDPELAARRSRADSPEAIDALLEAGRGAEALAVRKRVAEQPDDRSLGRFLHQYGLSYGAVKRPRDAAVMFMRCAVHYPSSATAADSLIETALIYRDEYRRAETARRLLERAVERAEELDQRGVAERGRRLLATLPPDRGGRDD